MEAEKRRAEEADPQRGAARWPILRASSLEALRKVDFPILLMQCGGNRAQGIDEREASEFAESLSDSEPVTAPV